MVLDAGRDLAAGQVAALARRRAAACRAGAERDHRAGARPRPPATRDLRRSESYVHLRQAYGRPQGTTRSSGETGAARFGQLRRNRKFTLRSRVPCPTQLPSGSSSDLGVAVEPHGRPAGRFVARPARIAGAGERDPGPVHRVRRSRRVRGPSPVNRSAPGCSNVSNTKGISSAWVDRRMPPNTGVSQREPVHPHGRVRGLRFGEAHGRDPEHASVAIADQRSLGGSVGRAPPGTRGAAPGDRA